MGWIVIGSLFTAIHIIALDRFCARHNNMTLTFLQISTMAVIFLGLQHISGGEILPRNWSSKLDHRVRDNGSLFYCHCFLGSGAFH